jgi:hypothetical protein
MRRALADKANQYNRQQLNAYYHSPQDIEAEIGESFDDWFQKQVEAGKRKMKAKLGTE